MLERIRGAINSYYEQRLEKRGEQDKELTLKAIKILEKGLGSPQDVSKKRDYTIVEEAIQRAKKDRDYVTLYVLVSLIATSTIQNFGSKMSQAFSERSNQPQESKEKKLSVSEADDRLMSSIKEGGNNQKKVIDSRQQLLEAYSKEHQAYYRNIDAITTTKKLPSWISYEKLDASLEKYQRTVEQMKGSSKTVDDLVIMRQNLLKKEIDHLNQVRRDLPLKGNEKILNEICNRLIELYDDLKGGDDMILSRVKLKKVDYKTLVILQREPLTRAERESIESNMDEIEKLKLRIATS